MIAIHPVHRRLAQLTLKAVRSGGFAKLTEEEQKEIEHCLRVNESLVWKMDAYKELALHAHEMGDMKWELELCGKIDELEAKML